MYSRDGQLKWRVADGYGGPPTIADVDGDGIPEIGVAGASTYTVYKADGTVMWARPTVDYSSASTGSTFFDFDGDGQSDALYADEYTMRVYNGRTGDLRWSIPNPTGTALEYPLVVDTDNDGHADIVVVSNNLASQGVNGVRVFQDQDNQWVPARTVWNQHAYSINNINDDLTVPRNPVPSWQTHNTFRLNKRIDADPRAIADLTIGYLRSTDGGVIGNSSLTVRAGNAGSYKVPVGTLVAFYRTNPALGTPTASALIGTTIITQDLQPGEYQDITLQVAGSLASLSVSKTIWIVGDDNGAGQNAIVDFNRANNVIAGDLSGISVSGQLSATPSVTLIGQSVALALSVNNNGNALLLNLPITIRVIDPHTGNVLATYTQTLASLSVGQSLSVNATWPAGGVDGQILIAVASASLGGQEITLAQAQIRLQGLAQLRVAPAQLNFGSLTLGQSTGSQIITVSSIGSASLQSLSFNLGGIDPTAFIVQGGTCVQGMSLAINTSCTLSVAYQPGQAKTHSASLSFGHAAAGNVKETVSLTGQAVAAVQTVQLQSAPILPKDARILVLASCQQSSNSDDHEERDDDEDDKHRESRGESCSPQPEKANCTSERALAIGQYLDGLGILNKVVTDEASFRHQMRCGGYNIYWISGGASKIEHGLVKEVREAVWRGDGLIIDGQHDDRNLLLDAVAGVKYRGKLPGSNYTAHIPAGSVFAPSSSSGANITSTLATLGQPARYELLTGTVQASFTARTSTTPTDQDSHRDKDGNSNGSHDSSHDDYSSSSTSTTRTVPAIIANRYGAGNAMLFAFDLAAMVTQDVQQTATVNLPLERIVLTTAAQVGAANSSTSSPAGSTTVPGTLTVGDISAQGVLLHNPSSQTITAQVSISLPAQLAYSSANLVPASVIAASGGATGSPAQVNWTVQLAPQQSTTLTWRVRVESVSTTSATYTIPVQVASLGQGGASTAQASYSFTLHAVSGAALVQAALPAVQALQPVASAERNAKARALAAIASATSLHNQGRYVEAIAKWIDAANELMSLSTLSASSPSNQALVAAARTAVALALEASTDGQCQALMCLRGDLALSTSTPVLGTSLGLTRSITNSCPAPLKDIPVLAALTNRRTQQNLLSLADSKLDLTVGQTSSRTASAPVQAPQAQGGDWLDALLTAQWQGHNIELAARTAQVTAPVLASCPAGGTVSTSRFTALAEAERLDVRAGKPGNANPASDWEWGLGANTNAAGQFSAASLDWTSGTSYYWTVTTDAHGKGVFTVRNGSAIVAQGSYDKAAAQLRSGNAIRISVSSASDVGSAKIAASLLKIEGQSVNHSVLTTAASQSNSLVITHPTLNNGMAAEGTVRLDFSGSAPPAGSKLNFTLNAGTVQCP